MLMEQGYSAALGPRLRRQYREGVECIRILPRRSWKVIGTSLLAILVATFKDGLAFRRFNDRSDWFSDLVLLGLAAVWLLWSVAFASEFFGTEIVSVQHGELVVSRGIGRLRRTFRYPVREIMELVGTDPATDEDQKGKGRVHNIFFKAKSGAARFEFGFKTVYFAETLDEAGGEAIVRWLQPRLPRGACEMVLGLGYAG